MKPILISKIPVLALTVLATFAAEAKWIFVQYATNNRRILDVSDDGLNTNWVFVVSGTTSLSLSSYVSGSGDLDFSTFDVEGKTLVSGAGVLTSRPELTGYLNTGPMTTFTKIQSNPNLKQVFLPSVTNLANYLLKANSTLTNATLSADVAAIGSDIFGSCPLLESILPERLPKLKSIGSLISTTPTALTLRLDVPELETLGQLGAVTVAALAAPKLKTLNAKAFYNVKFAEGAGDLSFPELESMSGTWMFKWSGMTSLYAPKLANLESQAIYECSSLTNLTFSDALKSVVAGSVYNCQNLTSFSPLLPANMTTVTDFFSTKAMPITSPFVWDQNSTTEVPASLCRYLPLTNFVFVSEVTSVGANAFAAIGPKAEIHFQGDTVPSLGNGAFYRTNAERNDDRPVIHVHSSTAWAGWLALSSPNAGLFPSYQEKSDCPDGAVGLIALPNSSGASPIYAYLVNDAASSGSGYLTVSGSPLDLATVVPPYGTRADIPNGDTFTCSAPTSLVADGCRATLAGYVISNVTATGETSFRAGGAGNSYDYEQLTDSALLTWLWRDVQYRIRAAAEGDGTVSVAEQWVNYLGTATVTAVPAAGKVFRCWQGDVSAVDAYHPMLTLTADAAKLVTAVFTDPVDDVWTYDSAKHVITYGGSDGLDVKWSFTVTENSGKLTLSSYVSGVGDLDFSTFAVDGKTLVGSGVNALSSCPGLTGYLNTGTMTSVTVKNNPNLKQLVLPSVTNVVTYSLQQNSMLTNVIFSSDVETIGGDVFKSCPLLESILPERLPKLKSILSLISTTPTALTLRLDAPELETLGQLGAVTVAALSLPKLKTLHLRAFSSVKFTRETEDLSLPALEGLSDGYVFRYSGLTSLSAPMLTNVTYLAFDSCASLTNLVFSDALKVISDNAFGSCPKLVTFSPLLPAGLLQLGATPFGSGNSADRLTGALVWDNPTIPVVPAYLLQKSPLESVIFRSDVTAVMTNAFAALAPSARVEFHGPTVPDLVRTPFDHDGEADNTRVRIYVCNREALDGWRVKVASNDALYRADFKRKKPDWPGRQTLGILELSDGRYAWVVDGTPGPGFSIQVR